MSTEPTTPKKKDRRLPSSAVKERRALDLWAEFGGNFRTIMEFGDALGPPHGFNGTWLKHYRNRHPSFRAKMDSIEQNRTTKAENDSRAAILAQERWPDLEKWQGIWIERYRETCSRVKACTMVGKTWVEVQEILKTDEAFSAARDSIEAEFLAAIEDAHVNLAKNGKGGAAATNILETQSERFSKMKARKQAGNKATSLLEYDVAEARERAKQLFRECNVGDPPGSGLAAP